MATSVNFDKNSTAILKQVDPIHRESVINLGIALVSKTEYFKTISGEGSDNIEDVVSLNALGINTPTSTTVVEEKPAKKAVSPVDWDAFDQ